jgi:hypothetical protein
MLAVPYTSRRGPLADFNSRRGNWRGADERLVPEVLTSAPRLFKEKIMTFQAKLVNPNGSPKAVVATHDRVASGKEFALFTQLLGMMAIGSVPAEGFTPCGHQMSRLIDPDEIVDRAEEIVTRAMRTAEDRGWTVETDDIDRIYEDLDAEKALVGFSPPPVNLADDDIPF